MHAILADDLSGATEIAGVASRSGTDVIVCLDLPKQRPEADTVVIDSNTRLLSPGESETRVTRICQSIRSWDTASFFKKVDSILRGPVTAEIEAIMKSLGQKRAILASANPSMGRFIRKGHYLINSVPLEKTSFAQDPHHPRQCSEVRKLIDDHPRILTPDVGSMKNLEAIARSLEPEDLPVGASDFYLAWSGAPEFRPPALSPGKRQWVLGSRAGSDLKGRKPQGFPVPFPESNSFSSSQLDEWTARSMALAANTDSMVLSVPSKPGNPRVITENLTKAAHRLVKEWHPDQVFLAGGATARAFVEFAGWKSLRVEAELAQGIVMLRPEGQEDAPALVIKPGSYPWPELDY